MSITAVETSGNPLGQAGLAEKLRATQLTAYRASLAANIVRRGAEKTQAEHLASQECAVRKRAENDRQRITEMVAEAQGLLSNARHIMDPLRFQGLLSESTLNMQLVDGQTLVGEPGQELYQAIQVGRQALLALQAAIQEFIEVKKQAAMVRLGIAGLVLVLAQGGIVFWGGWLIALLIFPLFVGLTIPLLHLDHVVSWFDRFHCWAKDIQERSGRQKIGWFSKPYLGGVNFIKDATDCIEDPHLQTGTRAAFVMYYSGTALAAALLAAYIFLGIAIALLVNAVDIWIDAKVLESA